MPGRTDQPDQHATQADDGRPAATYLAECYWPGVTADKLADTATRAAGQAEATCLELILIPGDEIVLGLFRASSAAAVTHVSHRAGLPVERIVESLRVRPHRLDLRAASRDRLPGATGPPHHNDRRQHD